MCTAASAAATTPEHNPYIQLSAAASLARDLCWLQCCHHPVQCLLECVHAGSIADAQALGGAKCITWDQRHVGNLMHSSSSSKTAITNKADALHDAVCAYMMARAAQQLPHCDTDKTVPSETHVHTCLWQVSLCSGHYSYDDQMPAATWPPEQGHIGK